MIDIVPGIQEKEWEAALQKIILVAPHVQWIHIDFLDGTLSPGETVMDFSRLPDLTRTYPHLSFGAHLMVSNPEKYVNQFDDWGFKRISSHVESNDPRRFLEAVKFEDAEVGIAIDGPTEVEEIEPFLEEVDYAVIMTAEAGAVGQPFLPETIEKIKAIRENFPDLAIEVVGGITLESAPLVKEAGASRIVTNHFLFKDSERIVQTLAELKSI